MGGALPRRQGEEGGNPVCKGVSCCGTPSGIEGEGAAGLTERFMGGSGCAGGGEGFGGGETPVELVSASRAVGRSGLGRRGGWRSLGRGTATASRVAWQSEWRAQRMRSHIRGGFETVRGSRPRVWSSSVKLGSEPIRSRSVQAWSRERGRRGSPVNRSGSLFACPSGWWGGSSKRE